MKEFIRNKIRKGIMEAETTKAAAGALIKTTDTGKILLLLRNDEPAKRNTWSMITGGIEPGESVLEGLKREITEELSIDPSIITYKFMSKDYVPSKKLNFTWYEGLTPKEFIPTLDEENLEYGWFDIDDLPSPLFPGLIDNINMI